uniref:(northern house mosquito) hypothetical protein n=1 Tax=Culex pipiens TaxID=7175 RepID=A0A8D8MT55_CULPI
MNFCSSSSLRSWTFSFCSKMFAMLERLDLLFGFGRLASSFSRFLMTSSRGPSPSYSCSRSVCSTVFRLTEMLLPFLSLISSLSDSLASITSRTSPSRTAASKRAGNTSPKFRSSTLYT